MATEFFFTTNNGSQNPSQYRVVFNPTEEGQPASITITRLSGSYPDPILWSTASGTASSTASETTSSPDFTASSGIINLDLDPNTSNPQSTTITIQTTADGDLEGTEFFYVRFTDDNGQTTTFVKEIQQQITDPANSPPNAVDDSASTSEDTPITFTAAQFKANDTDPNSGDTLTIIAVGSAMGGTFELNTDGTITFTPDANYNGPASFTYTVSDGKGGTDTATVNVNVAAVNDAPVAAAIAGTSVNEDQAVSYQVPAFTDIDSTLTYSAALANGRPLPVWLHFDLQTRTFTGTPPQDFNGFLDLEVTGSDGSLSASAEFRLTVNPVNDAPVAADDLASGGENETLVIGVLANDEDVDAGAILTLVSGEAPAGQGTVTVEEGRLVFDPGSDFDHLAVGEQQAVEIAYVVEDENGARDTATVTVTVTGANDRPVITSLPGDKAAEFLAEGNGGLTATGTSTVIDADASDAVTVEVREVEVHLGTTPPTSEELIDGEGLTDAELAALGLDREALLAALTVYPTDDRSGDSYAHDGTQGTLTWEFDSGEEAFDLLSEGEILTLYYDSIRPDDGHGPTTTGDGGIVIQITGRNDGPTLASGVLNATEDGTTVALDLAGLGDDVDGDDDGASLTYEIAGGPSGGSAEIVDGDLVFDPGRGFQSLADGATRDVAIQVRATDSHGATAVNTVTVTVTGTNDAPVITSASVLLNLAETDGDLTASGAIVWEDLDAEDLHAVTRTAVVAATGIVLTAGREEAFGEALTIDDDGAWSFGLDAADSQFLAQGESVKVTYTLRVEDPKGAHDTQDITVTIGGTNDGPVASDDAATTGENAAVSIDVLGNDTDVDHGHSLTLLRGEVASGRGTVEVVDGALLYDPGTAYDHLARNATATVTMTYVIEDEHGARSTAEVEVTVEGRNDGPTARSDTASGGENQTLAIDVLGNDTDPDDGAAFTLVGGSAPAGKGSVSVSGNRLVFDPGTRFDHLGQGEQTTVTLDYTMRDEHGAESTSSVEVTITGVNDAPVAAPDSFGTGSRKVYEGMEFSLDAADLLWNDEDAEDDALTILSATDGSKGSTRLVTDATGTYVVYTYTGSGLTETATTTDAFTYTISDGHGGTSTATVDLTVTGLANRITTGTNQIDNPLNGSNTAHDTIDALNADDRVYGHGGNDKLFGNNGSDWLFGGDGADCLDGGNGDDRLDGGKGADTLIGGRGADSFVFERVDGAIVNTGADTITDFKLGTDDVVLGSGITLVGVATGNYAGTAELDTMLTLSNGGTIKVLDVSGLGLDQWMAIA